MSKKYKNIIQRFLSFERAKNGYIYCREYSYNIILKSYKYVMNSIKNGNSVVRHPKDGLAGSGVSTVCGCITYPKWIFTYHNNYCYDTSQLGKLWRRFRPNDVGEYNAYEVAAELKDILGDCNVYFRRGYSADTFNYLEGMYLLDIIKELIIAYDVDLNGIV